LTSLFGSKQKGRTRQDHTSGDGNRQEIDSWNKALLVGHPFDTGDLVQDLHGNAVFGPAAVGAGGDPEAQGSQQQHDGGDLQTFSHGLPTKLPSFGLNASGPHCAIDFARAAPETGGVPGFLTTSARWDLDYAVAQQCMHCGLCLPHCPTYAATGRERHSPRGRIALMRAIADDHMPLTRAFAEEMNFCLGCLACMTACPAGVDYAALFEHSREQAEASGTLRTPVRDGIRAMALRWLFLDLRRLHLAARVLRLYQELGLQALLRRCGIPALLPKALRQMETLAPEMQPQVSADLIAPLTPARGQMRYRVALLTGCVQDVLFAEVNRDTVEVLAENGCEVVTPPEQDCCGSIHAHNGETGPARQLARRHLDRFPPDQFDAIITNAGGCGSHLKRFAELLRDDSRYYGRAQAWDRKVKDIHEWLVEIGFRAPQRSERAARSARTVATYHEACHLCHGQGITSQPRQILRSIPDLTLVELPESTWCCGSAGVYNLTQPAMAELLLQRKLNHIQSTGAGIVATGNPGCLLQLSQGARRARIQLRLAHPVSLLAEAYRRADSASADGAGGVSYVR
jgi:glycolate oxidase iron-sulfur subunit